MKWGWIQIAGFHDRAELAAIASSGADAAGLPLRLDYHQSDLSESDAAALAANAPIDICIITYETSQDGLLNLLRRIPARFLQLHADPPLETVETVGRAFPQVKILKSLVIGRTSFDHVLRAAIHYSPVVDAFLTDTHDPVSGASGATGMTHDWSLSAELRMMCTRPLILAGGLHPGNVASAIQAVKPAGVDCHTGVENRDGRKDPARMQAFVETARATFRAQK